MTEHHEHHDSNHVLGNARKYARRGWQVVPIPAKGKAPHLENWQHLRIEEADIPKYFGKNNNIGILLGEPSNGLVDVDLDCRQAILLAPSFLPKTERVHGRRSRRSSHFWYRCTDHAPKSEKFCDTDGTCLAEIRSTGQQTVVPPSIHPCGERLRWDKESGEPAQVFRGKILADVKKFAAAILIARHWPSKGSRNETSLALAGALLRAGWQETETAKFIECIARAADDEQADKRGAAVKATKQRLDQEERVTGIPRLKELINSEVVTKVCDWLGIGAGDELRDGKADPLLSVYYPYQFLTQEENDNESDDLVQHIVPKRGATLIYGLPKELKSWISLGIAVAVATGKDKALGHFAIPRAAKVMYVQVEDPDALLRDRLRMVDQGGSLCRLRTLTNLRIIPRCGLNLMNTAWVRSLKHEIEGHKPELIVMDVFRRLFRGNPSDAKDTADFLRVLDELRDTYGCAIVLVHHARKSGTSEIQSMALGSVNLTAWADVLIYTSGKHPVGNTSVADLKIETKSSLAEEHLQVIVDSESEPMVCIREKGGSLEAVVKLIRMNPSLDQKQLQEKSGIPIKKLRSLLEQGEEQGLLRRTLEGGRHRYAYCVVEVQKGRG